MNQLAPSYAIIGPHKTNGRTREKISLAVFCERHKNQGTMVRIQSSSVQNDFDFASASLAGQRVLVTGATGFIGRRLVDGLLASGAEVSALVRTRQNAGDLARHGVRLFPGSLGDVEKLSEALSEQAIVFNLAYDVRASGDENLLAFQALLQGAERAAVNRIIHASSMVVYDSWPGGRISEREPITRDQSGSYRDAKIAMEEMLLDSSIPAAILQPGIVHGPGSAMWTDAPRRALRRGPVILPDPIGLCAAIHVDDVVQAALKAAAVEKLDEEKRYVLNGPGRPNWLEFYRSHISALGEGEILQQSFEELQARLPAIQDSSARSGAPSGAARVSAFVRKVMGRSRFEALVRFVSDLTIRKGPVYPDRQMLALYSACPDISCDHAREHLGFMPRNPL